MRMETHEKSKSGRQGLTLRGWGRERDKPWLRRWADEQIKVSGERVKL